MTQTTGHQSAADPLRAAFAADNHGSRDVIDGGGSPEAREKDVEATVADQRAHIAMLTERHTFLTDREAELRQLLASVHAQLLMRDTDKHKLLALLERTVEEQARRIDTLTAKNDILTADNAAFTADNTALTAQLSDVIAAKESYVAETERYVAELERSWDEKNAHIATLEAMGPPARRGLLGRVIGRARSIIARW